MKLVEAINNNNESSIRLVGNREGIEALQEFVTSCALGALEQAREPQAANIKKLMDGLYDLEAVTEDLIPTFATVIGDRNLLTRRDTILTSALDGRLGAAEYARERRAQEIPVHDLFVTSQGLTGYLVGPASASAEENGAKAWIKPRFWTYDASLSTEADAVAHSTGATHYSYGYEIVPQGINYKLLADHEYFVLGSETETGAFMPTTAVLNSDHPARQVPPAV